MADSERLAKLGFKEQLNSTSGVRVFIPPLCPVPAGPFIMGTKMDSETPYPEQFPEHEVTLPAYALGRYPVTVAEYAYALDAGADGAREPVNWSSQRAFLLHPVSGLTWYDASAYAQWLTEQTGASWRLPSEAEWEKAARGTDGRIYPWGNSWDPERINAWEVKSGGEPVGSRPDGDTTAVDAYPLGASPYGVMDLVGNVAQWTSTIWDPPRFPFPYRSDDGREELSEKARFRIHRGGSWLSGAEAIRADCREMFHTTDRFDWLIGMRLVRDVGSP
jgi:formylglycine-generating enzyme required for sulfatase activity